MFPVELFKTAAEAVLYQLAAAVVVTTPLLNACVVSLQLWPSERTHTRSHTDEASCRLKVSHTVVRLLNAQRGIHERAT